MKKEIESLKRKIGSLDDSIKRKNQDLKEKDKFMTTFLLPKVKDESKVDEIIREINNYFSE